MTSTRPLTLALAAGLCLAAGPLPAQIAEPRLAFPRTVPAAHRSVLVAQRRIADSLAARAPQPLPVRGRASAPVTIEIFADFQCPACRMFELQADTTLEALARAGTVRVVYYDFPLPFHAGAPDAAMLAHCAPKRAFHRVRRVLYESQDAWGSAAEPRKVFRRVLEVAGVTDKAGVLACYEEGRYLDLLRFGVEESERRQLTATPTTFVGGEPVMGAIPPKRLRELVTQKLTGKSPPAPRVPTWRQEWSTRLAQQPSRWPSAAPPLIPAAQAPVPLAGDNPGQ